MEDTENSGGSFDGKYKLLCKEDDNADEQPLNSNHENQQALCLPADGSDTDPSCLYVAPMSMVRPRLGLDRYKVLAVSLAALAVILLIVDIGLGVYYNTLTSGRRTIANINSELAKLQTSYNTIIQNKNEVTKQLAKEISEQQMIMWETEFEIKKLKDYENQLNRIENEVEGIKFHLPMLEEGCRHCLPGWIFTTSGCFYLDLSSNSLLKSWQDARQFCISHGSDLAVTNTKEKHLALSNLLNKYFNPSQPVRMYGFWIGLTDTEEEGVWKWLDGTTMTLRFWNDGEPNNAYNIENCAATYPRSNPFKAWNDAVCSNKMRWICEMAPR